MKAAKSLGWLCVAAILCGTAGWAEAPGAPAQRKPPKPTAKRRPTTPPTGAVSGVHRPTPRNTHTQPVVPPPSPSEQARSGEHPLVALEITAQDKPWGRIVLELHPERSPRTVYNFLHYVDDGFYDGTIFHRVLPGFIIQGGGYVSLTEEKTAGLQPPIRNESRRGAPKNERGTIAMARKREPHTAVCQFYINVAKNEQLDYPKAGAYGYCVFGTVIEGMDVVDRIANIPTRVSAAAQRRFERYASEERPAEEPEKSEPLHPPMIKRARRLTWEEYEASAPEVRPVTRPVVEPAEPPVVDEEPPPEDEELDEPEDLPDDERGDEPGDEPEDPEDPG